MKRISFLHTVFLSLLVFSFFSFLEFDEEKVSLASKEKEASWIIHDWVVTEAYHLETGQEVTTLHSSEVWQFNTGNNFVLYKARNIESIGYWEMKNGEMIIKDDEFREDKIFRIERKGRNELLMTSKDIKMRLLKLDEV